MLYTNCYCADNQGSDKIPAEPRSSGSSEKRRTMPAEEAFRKALGSLKGRVDFLDTNGLVVIQRSQHAAWWFKITNYSDIPPGGLSITVSDQGIVDCKLAGRNVPANDWLASSKGGKENTRTKMRPEVAFRKAINILAEWYGYIDVLYVPDGKMTFCRGHTDEWWFMDVSGYSGMRLGGYWITVQDDGHVKVIPGI